VQPPEAGSGDGLTVASTHAEALVNGAPATGDDLADDRDVAAELRDGQANDRDRASDEQDVIHGRPGRTRAVQRAAARQDRESAAEDRRCAALDRSAAAASLAQAAERIDSLLHDSLTGFFPRGAGWTELERMAEQCQETGEPFTVAFVDIDGLKAVNDAAGHEAGDSLIRVVSDAIKSVLRDCDIVIRYGGDEFICGMPGISEVTACERFADMQKQLAEGGRGMASVGTAQLQPCDSLQDVISRADTAMYASKSDPGLRRQITAGDLRPGPSV